MLSQLDTNGRNMYIGSIVAGGKKKVIEKLDAFEKDLHSRESYATGKLKAERKTGESKKCDVIGATVVQKKKWKGEHEYATSYNR